MKLSVVYFTAVILIKMKFHFGDKMLCKQYPEMTSYENKHLRMQIKRKHTIRIPVVKFVLQSKASCSKEIEYYLSLFPNEVSNIKLYIFRQRFTNDTYKKMLLVKRSTSNMEQSQKDIILPCLCSYFENNFKFATLVVKSIRFLKSWEFL